MSKNKYANQAETKVGVDGERKQRDHTKTGKLARRRENRRLEAIARQVQRIRQVEAGVAGQKVDKDITDYLKTFTVPADAIIHATKTLQKIRGGIPHSQVDNTVFKGDTTTKPVTQSAADYAAATEKPKSKYKQKRKGKAEAAAPSKN